MNEKEHRPKSAMEALEAYREHCASLQMISSGTATAYLSDAMHFSVFVKSDSVDYTQEQLSSWLDSLEVSASTRKRKLCAIRHFFAFLGLREPSVARKKEKLRRQDANKRKLLTQDEVEQIVRAIDISSHMGVRDQAMVYTYFATGLKSSMLVNLKTSGVLDTKDGLFVTTHRGLIRLSGACEAALRMYLESSRIDMLKGRASDFVFVTWFGKQMTRQSLWCIIKKHARLAGVTRNLSRLSLEMASQDIPTRVLTMSPMIRKIEAFLAKHPELESTYLVDKVLDELEIKIVLSTPPRPKLSESKIVATRVPWSKP